MKDKETVQEKKDEFIDVFKYFESANLRNREAFSELLRYTMESMKKPPT